MTAVGSVRKSFLIYSSIGAFPIKSRIAENINIEHMMINETKSKMALDCREQWVLAFICFT
jgi:hypothetical protein